MALVWLSYALKQFGLIAGLTLSVLILLVQFVFLLKYLANMRTPPRPRTGDLAVHSRTSARHPYACSP